MTERSNTPHDPLDGLLDDAGPATTLVTDAIEDELARMSVAAQTDHRPARAGRGFTRAGAIGVAAVVLLGGAGAAAASTGGLLPWWQQESPDSFSVTLPSGMNCEFQVIGNLQGPTPAISEETAAYLRSVDIAAILDVDAEIQKQRMAPPSVARLNGKDVQIGYGTENYPSPDVEYVSAVPAAVTTAVAAELQRNGYDVDPDDFSWQSDAICPGMQW
ncbi:hypothetical protein [Microbacterium sp. NPDC064584]|uniref:hypothetical protein n=1 Tax=Microbacterium sp. NPDC064584 TaxID=3155817 RepID=UPI003415C971